MEQVPRGGNSSPFNGTMDGASPEDYLHLNYNLSPSLIERVNGSNFDSITARNDQGAGNAD